MYNYDIGKTENAKRILDFEKIGVFVIKKSIYTLMGYFAGLCSLVFGANPFGIALLAAADKNAIFVYLGLVLTSLLGFPFETGMLLLGVYSVMILLRVLLRLTLDCPFPKGSKQSAFAIFSELFRERAGYRIVASAFVSVAYGIVVLSMGGFLFYDLFALFVMALCTPIAAYFFYCFFEKDGVLFELGFLAVSAACVYGSVAIKPYGVSVSVLLGLLLTFVAGHKRGAIRGGATGLVLGVLYSPPLCPAFAFAGLCMGALRKISVPLACTAAFFASVGWGFYIKGLSALDGFFAGAIFACTLYSVVNKLYFSRGKEGAKKEHRAFCKVLPESELDWIRLSQMNRRMFAISDGLQGLSDFFEEIKMRFPKEDELLEICRSAFELSCGGCPEYDECLENGRIERAVEMLSERLLKKVSLCKDDVDAELSYVCARLPDILDEINYNSGTRRTREDGDSFAPEYGYGALSRLLEKSVEVDEGEYEIDKETSEKLCSSLDSLGADIDGVMIYGKRRRTVYVRGRDIDKLFEQKENIFEALTRSLAFSLDKDSVAVLKCSGGGAFFVNEAERFCVKIAQRKHRAKGEKEYCGDSLLLFKNKDSMFFSLISDGMGSGREAAAVSEICARFTESMLGAGKMSEELLTMLNGILRGRCEGSMGECSATFDLMELDLVSGSTEFYKSGAAPSYVYRNGGLFKLRSCTMPIGILDDADAKSVKFDLNDGDVVVMMSDGVTGGEDECAWLFDLLLQNVGRASLERIADLILKYAVGHGSEDDISVAVVKIERQIQ